MSVGAATFPDDAETIEEAVRIADQRMYQDKPERKRVGPRNPTPVSQPLGPE